MENRQMDKDMENRQMDEGLGNFISLSLIAGLISINGIVNAKDIVQNVPNKPTMVQFQDGLKSAEKTDKLYDDYTALQVSNILTRTIYGEAKGESLEGKKMVATVIWNRAGGKLENIPNICFAKKQFSVWNKVKGKTAKTYQVTIPKEVLNNSISKKAWDDCKNIVEEMMKETFTPLGNWNSYLNPETADKSAVDGWGTSMGNQKTVGKHKFGYQKRYDGSLAPLKNTEKKVSTEPKYLEKYTVKKGDKGVSYIAKELIKTRKTPITKLTTLTNKIIELNKLGPKATIHVGDVLKLPQK